MICPSFWQDPGIGSELGLGSGLGLWLGSGLESGLGIGSSSTRAFKIQTTFMKNKGHFPSYQSGVRGMTTSSGNVSLRLRLHLRLRLTPNA
jgi:hypothetical protein